MHLAQEFASGIVDAHYRRKFHFRLFAGRFVPNGSPNPSQFVYPVSGELSLNMEDRFFRQFIDFDSQHY